MQRSAQFLQLQGVFVIFSNCNVHFAFQLQMQKFNVQLQCTSCISASDAKFKCELQLLNKYTDYIVIRHYLFSNFEEANLSARGSPLFVNTPHRYS